MVQNSLLYSLWYSKDHTVWSIHYVTIIQYVPVSNLANDCLMIFIRKYQKDFLLELSSDTKHHQNVKLKIWLILRWPKVSQFNQYHRNFELITIFRLRYTVLKVWDRTFWSRCYSERPVGSFRWSEGGSYQSNSFRGPTRKYPNTRSTRVRRSTCNKLYTF